MWRLACFTRCLPPDSTAILYPPCASFVDQDIATNYHETNYKILLQINYTDKLAKRPDDLLARQAMNRTRYTDFFFGRAFLVLGASVREMLFAFEGSEGVGAS